MPNNQLRYDQMIEEALRGVVRRALRSVAASGLPGNHHFYITFKTTAPGVEIADRLREKYPDEMTIVLQHQFWGLEVAAERFVVSLSFNDIPERLVVPFASVTAFADPAAKFGLQFQQETGAADDEAAGEGIGLADGGDTTVAASAPRPVAVAAPAPRPQRRPQRRQGRHPGQIPAANSGVLRHSSGWLPQHRIRPHVVLHPSRAVSARP
ncbi:MAG: ClpXP protease specificity-enhancing factor SspB [Pseudomonadota bacterium]